MSADKLNFDTKPPVKCIHCKKERGRHKAVTFECPVGRGNFPRFIVGQTFQSKTVKITNE